MFVRQGHGLMIIPADHGLGGDHRVDHGLSIAKMVASKRLSMQRFESILSEAVLDASSAPGLAAEKAMKMSPEPLPETLPVRAIPRAARRAIRFS